LNASNNAYGIYLQASSGNTFVNSTVRNYSTVQNESYGVYLNFSDNNEFINNTIYELDTLVKEDYGIYLNASNYNNFSNTNIHDLKGEDDAYGIVLWSSNNNTFSSSTAVSNINATAAYGIGLLYSNNNTFSSSTTVSYVNATAAYGIGLSNSDDNEFYDCTISDLTAGGALTSYGVYMVSGSDNNIISRAKIFRGGGPIIDYGVYMDNCTLNSIVDSEIRDNGHGIWVNQSSNNTIERNMIVNNKGGKKTGVHITEGSDANEIHENCFYNNEPYQAWDDTLEEAVIIGIVTSGILRLEDPATTAYPEEVAKITRH